MERRMRRKRGGKGSERESESRMGCALSNGAVVSLSLFILLSPWSSPIDRVSVLFGLLPRPEPRMRHTSLPIHDILSRVSIEDAPRGGGRANWAAGRNVVGQTVGREW